MEGAPEAGRASGHSSPHGAKRNAVLRDGRARPPQDEERDWWFVAKELRPHGEEPRSSAASRTMAASPCLKGVTPVFAGYASILRDGRARARPPHQDEVDSANSMRRGARSGLERRGYVACLGQRVASDVAQRAVSLGMTRAGGAL